ncbi:hypothetical protein F5Y00DRAFT_244698 [Daldinia vernicosa]|uniref:uncharacterized protein n=1 Tax=Daldinia vernicosa TaxID=114800 RepID=UPI0020081FE6|nr:uncharacterized protein F5Y00DRAFT_244698 [Daldinia vernicosa]KAI0846176.1 hypothetical protein F5Y00DRAFT_244698 [Daldinia vernicosa]
MRQERICCWLGRRTCTHNRTFLDLPASVRRRIYDYAGLISGRSVYIHSLKQPHEDFEGVNHARKRFESDPCTECDELHFTFHLLQTCKAVYTEVSAIVYSENDLVVPDGAVEDGLRILGNITPSACSKLTNLYVHLSMTGGYCPGGYIRDSRKTEPIRKSRIAAWQKTAKHILTHSSPQKLRLHFICDLKSQISIVSDVLAPFHDSPGSIKDCALRLNRKKYKYDKDNHNNKYKHDKDNHGKDDLYSMARQAAIIVSASPSTRLDQPFRFLDLPQDLQQSILKYTDLITPTNEVRWNPQRGFYFEYPIEHGTAYHGRFICADYHHNLGCFCMSEHCVYSSRCRCWRPPQALFLVSRAMYESSRAVFYTYNRIIIIPIMGIWQGRSHFLAGFETYIFVTKVLNPDTLSYLRYLELVCAPFETRDSSSSSDHVPYCHWLDSVDSLRTHANLPVLTIAIYMTRFEPDTYRIDEGSRKRVINKAFGEGNFILDNNEDLTLNTYVDILLPFRSLTCIGRFFVFFEWAGRYWKDEENQREINYRLSEVERWLEQEVMGSEYDSRALGKADIKHSQWFQAVQDYHSRIWG